ncbi:two-component response regulator [Raoultella planticola]|nr:two-component response regulator [Raoultella planticola]
MLQKLTSAWQLQQQSGSQTGTTANPQRENDTINLIKDERIIVTSISRYLLCGSPRKNDLCLHPTGIIRDANEHPRSFCGKLPPAHFFRCHRSYCVNLNKIREIEPWFNNTYILRLRDLEFQVPVSRSKVKEFRQLMHL